MTITIAVNGNFFWYVWGVLVAVAFVCFFIAFHRCVIAPEEYDRTRLDDWMYFGGMVFVLGSAVAFMVLAMTGVIKP